MNRSKGFLFWVAAWAFLLAGCQTLSHVTTHMTHGLKELDETWKDRSFDCHHVEIAELELVDERDAFQAIDCPRLGEVEEITDLDPEEAVLSFSINGVPRAYPKRLMHGWVNDYAEGVPIFVLQCPLSNISAVWVRRTQEGELLRMEPSGLLRLSKLLIYDDQTKSLWQPSTGTCIVGEHLGETLERIPCRIESLAQYQARNPGGDIALIPKEKKRHFWKKAGDADNQWAHDFFQKASRHYGRRPAREYACHHTYPIFSPPHCMEAHGNIPGDAILVHIPDLNCAWTLDCLRQEGFIQCEGVQISWRPGMTASAFGTAGKGTLDIGNVAVQRRNASGAWEDVLYTLPFMASFRAQNPEVVVLQENKPEL